MLFQRSRVRKSSPKLHLLQLEERITPAIGYALSNNSLIAFDTANPAAALAPLAVTNLGANENLVGIDFRPQNGLLYGLTSDGTGVRLYAISQRTGVATPLTAAVQTFDDGAGTNIPVTGTNFGLDFNPLADRLRVVTDTGLNFRINPNTGTIIDGNAAPGVNPDTNLTLTGNPATADAASYTNNQPNTTATSLYVLDAATNSIYLQAPPNGGTLTMGQLVTLNGATLDFNGVTGFDIPAGVNAPASDQPATGSGFAVLQIGTQSLLYTINLATGATTLLGGLGSTAVQGLAIENPLAGIPIVGLTNANSLIRFNSATSATTTTPVAISGLAGGETVVGIDFRPATGQLYGLSTDGAGGVRLLIIDPQTGVATPVTVGFQQFNDGMGNNVPILGTNFGVDFNPALDRFRIVTDGGFNFRMNPNTGALIDGDFGMATPQTGFNPDGAINGATTTVDGTAYTNSFSQVPGAVATTQYTIDAVTDSIYQQNLPNSGTQTNAHLITVGGTRLDFTAVNGFDIPAGVRVSTSNTLTAGFAIAALTTTTGTSLYSINLSTGVATVLGVIGTGTTPLAGMAIADVPTGSVQFASTTFTVSEGAGTATLNLTRTGGSVGTLTVVINATTGTATAGSDFSGTPITVSFADGQTTASVPLSILDDMIVEGNETITLTLSNPITGAVIGAMSSAVLTIQDNDINAVTSTAIGPVITTRNPAGAVQRTINPFPGFAGIVTTAVGDVNGDGTLDVIAGAGFGGGPHVKVIDGISGVELASFFAFNIGFRGGVFVAAGDINGDGKDDIIVGAGAGAGPHVKVFNATNFTEIRSFFAFGVNFIGGVRVAGGDINGDGKDDIIVGAGAGGGPHVRVFSGVDNSELRSFFAYDPGFAGGVYVGSGDVNGDGFDDIITGAGSSGPHVRVFSGQTNGELKSFFAFDTSFSGGVRVASNDANNDGFADIEVVPGPGFASRLRTFNGQTLALLGDVALSDPNMVGVFVG